MRQGNFFADDGCDSIPFTQLVYDFKDGGGTFGLLTLSPGDLEEKEKKKFEKIGVLIPSTT